MAKTNTKTSFGQRVEARQHEENIWQSFGSEAKFNAKSMVKSLEELANATFPADAYNSNAYQEAIAKSLTETISPEVGVNDFWKAMANAGCKTLRIEAGHLNFYADKEKLDITPFTQPIVFEAHSSYYRQRLTEREARIMEAKRQLQELLKEIHRR